MFKQAMEDFVLMMPSHYDANTTVFLSERQAAVQLNV